MAKTASVIHRRAYVNPIPGYSEAEQRADIESKFGKIGEWYVESVNVKRLNFIGSLRPGDEAVVAHMACLAMAGGKIIPRMADLDEARGDVHGQHATVIDTGGLSTKGDWKAVKAAVRAFLLVERNVKNGSKRKYNFTDKQLLRILEVRDLKSYTNDVQRLARLKKDGIVCGRTYMVTTALQEARNRGLVPIEAGTN